MSTTSAAAPRQLDAPAERPLAWAQPALAVGAAWGIALTVVSLGFDVTEDGHRYEHQADYWLTGLGIPLAISALLIVHAIRSLAAGRDGRRGRWGAVLFTAPMLVFTAMFIDGLISAKSSSWGPSYLLCVLFSDIGLGLLIAGLWRCHVLPRATLVAWGAAWFVGGPLSPPAAPLLLTAVYVVMSVQLRRRRG